MKIAVVNGSVRKGNRTQEIADALESILVKKHAVHHVSLSSFTKIYEEEYVSLKNCSEEQFAHLEAMKESDLIFFLVPIYHGGMPGVLKNFLDLLGVKSDYLLCIQRIREDKT